MHVYLQSGELHTEHMCVYMQSGELYTEQRIEYLEEVVKAIRAETVAMDLIKRAKVLT